MGSDASLRLLIRALKSTEHNKYWIVRTLYKYRFTPKSNKLQVVKQLPSLRNSTSLFTRTWAKLEDRLSSGKFGKEEDLWFEGGEVFFLNKEKELPVRVPSAELVERVECSDPWSETELCALRHDEKKKSLFKNKIDQEKTK